MKAVKQFWQDIVSPLLQGLSFTFSQFFTKPITHQYPEDKREVSATWRGLQCINVDDNGKIKCVACGLCEAVCPSQAIRIKAGENSEHGRYPEVFVLEVTRCIFCGFCEEACPKGAIEMTRNYIFCTYTRDEFHMNREVLIKNRKGGTP